MNYKEFYISRTEDCDENIGGYFCQVYADENMDYEIDNFCIHKEDLDKHRYAKENDLLNNEDLIIEYINNYFDNLTKLRKEVLK